MSKIIRFTAGALLGGIFGAGLALLLAPYNGTELRGRITDTAQGVFTDIQQAANERRAILEQDLARLRSPRQ
ncbi:MAG: YtxH domain-containing protein [Anaerolineae bacterium]|jgi:gas vesicle protein|nr:YtxH domain-containing protein [Anaerolineae bacterium]